MRLMDGLMAIPAILLAIALVALTRASVPTVIVAITIPEIPRVVRLVRAVVLGVREAPYVEAAISGGTPTWKILLRHILPSTIAPLIVQATYICASAILIEAALSFLGAGTPPEIPTWGNMIAQSRLFLSRAPWTIFAPGIALALVVLAVNLLGDGLRDRLDPRHERLDLPHPDRCQLHTGRRDQGRPGLAGRRGASPRTHDSRLTQRHKSRFRSRDGLDPQRQGADKRARHARHRSQQRRRRHAALGASTRRADQGDHYGVAWSFPNRKAAWHFSWKRSELRRRCRSAG